MQDRTFKVYVDPFEAEDLASSHSHHGSDKKGRSYWLGAFEFLKYGRDLGWLQDRWFDGSLSNLSHIGDGVCWVQFITHGVPEGRPEHLPKFLLIGKSILAGRLWSYHFEDQAVELVVRIIRTYIAEHRSIFERNPDCLRVLRELLDLFIATGWPSARIVAYRVDEIFR